MMFAEPPPSPGDLRFALFGIPVRVHPLFWLVALILGANTRDLRSLLIWIVALFMSILIHELGHALAVRSFGSRPAIILYGMGGLTSYAPIRRLGTAGGVLISLAGPGAGFLLAAVVCGAIKLSGHEVSVAWRAPYGFMVEPADQIGSWAFTFFLDQLLFVSVVWGLVNLLPIYPLDGGHIARQVLSAVNPRQGLRQSLLLSVGAAVLMAVFGLLHRDWFIALLFGYLAYSNYMAMQGYAGGDLW